MSVEITITIKDEEKKKLTKPFLVYEEVSLTGSDPVIQQCVNECLQEFKGEPDEIKVRAVLILR
jgi:hypothetical protein